MPSRLIRLTVAMALSWCTTSCMAQEPDASAAVELLIARGRLAESLLSIRSLDVEYKAMNTSSPGSISTRRWAIDREKFLYAERRGRHTDNWDTAFHHAFDGESHFERVRGSWRRRYEDESSRHPRNIQPLESVLGLALAEAPEGYSLYNALCEPDAYVEESDRYHQGELTVVVPRIPHFALSNWHRSVRVTLDPRHGYLPTMISLTSKRDLRAGVETEEIQWEQTWTILEFMAVHDAEQNASREFPKVVVLTQGPFTKNEAVVTHTSIRLNEQLPDSLFHPEGVE